MGYKEKIQQLESDLKEATDTIKGLNDAVKVMEKQEKGARQDKEKIKKLEEELKQAKETITELNGIVKPQTAGEIPDNDADIKAKMEQILQYQIEMDRKMGVLKEEVVEDMKNSKDIKAFSVTSFGYFANVLKAFEGKIPQKLQEIEDKFTGRFDELVKKHEEDAKKFDSIKHYINIIEGSMQNQHILLRKLHKADEDFKVELEQIAKYLSRFVDGINSQTINMALLKEDVSSKLERIETRDAESDYICRQCRTSLPKYILFNEDGVSVKCPNCDADNIVAKLQDKMKWIRFDKCEKVHIHQISKKNKQGKLKTCPSCEKQGKLVDLNDWMALPAWTSEHLKAYDSGQGLLFRLFNNPIVARPCVVGVHAAQCSAAHAAHAAAHAANVAAAATAATPSTANGST